jgi:hypothetical protein
LYVSQSVTAVTGVEVGEIMRNGESCRAGVPEANQLDLGLVRRSVDEDRCCLAPNQYPPSPNMVRSKTEVRIIVNFLSHLGEFSTGWSD